MNFNCTWEIGVLLHLEYKACWDCEKAGWSMPECTECNPENNFKWKRTRKN
jgi:hypothetical protein